ncbi:MAG: VOC family protein [Ferrovibrio sp.]|uniref:VOC family protein n=1 Tax=Ferrovibrio sp. TaxID=1917215 RepID=UPI0026193CE4|nr:VOC family protein [Ferrovibrio sp.]MCW0235943.1 VOC family protein [Ferrovibrio sp.]
MFSHIQVGARDLDRMIAFYDMVLAHVGLQRQPVEPDGGPPGAIWQRQGQRWPQFVVQLPFNGLPATWGNGWQVSFAAPSQMAVRLAWETALAHGGIDEGAPGLRPNYNDDYYGAYCRDPEGNKLCFVYAGGLP